MQPIFQRTFLCGLFITLALPLVACDHPKSPSTDKQTSDTPTSKTESKLDDETQALKGQLIPSAHDPNCKVPKTNYSVVYCAPNNDMFFFAENHKEVEYGYDIIDSHLINLKGEKVLDFKAYGYEAVGTLSKNGLIAVMKDDKVGYINTKGEVVIPIEYDSLLDTENKYDESWHEEAQDYGVIVAKNGIYGIVDANNKVVVPFEFGLLEAFDETGTGLYFNHIINIDANGYENEQIVEWGILDTRGKRIDLSENYEYTLGNFVSYDGLSEGLLAVMTPAQKWGFVDKDGKEVITPQYDDVRSFNEGVAGVMKGGKWGFVDKDNKTVIDFRYPDSTVPRLSVNFMGMGMFIFYDGVAEMSTDNPDETACINKQSQKVACEF